MSSIPDFGVSYVETFGDPEFANVIEDLRSHGIDAEQESREESVYASLEWVLPTAIVLFVADKYFGTLLEELAKEHYPRIRIALVRVISRVFARNNGPYLTVFASPPGKVKNRHEHAVSIYSRNRDGLPIKFLVDDSIAVDTAVDEIFEMMRQHFSQEPSVIDEEIEGVEVRRSTTFVFLRRAEGWRLVHPRSRSEPEES